MLADRNLVESVTRITLEASQRSVEENVASLSVLREGVEKLVSHLGSSMPNAAVLEQAAIISSFENGLKTLAQPTALSLKTPEEMLQTVLEAADRDEEMNAQFMQWFHHHAAQAWQGTQAMLKIETLTSLYLEKLFQKLLKGRFKDLAGIRQAATQAQQAWIELQRFFEGIAYGDDKSNVYIGWLNTKARRQMGGVAKKAREEMDKMKEYAKETVTTDEDDDLSPENYSELIEVSEYINQKPDEWKVIYLALPPKERHVYYLFTVEKLPCDKIARYLGMSKEEVIRRLSVAQERLGE